MFVMLLAGAAAVVRRVEVAGPSMEPTLQAGDRLVVQRTARRRRPRRGDVVVAQLPGRGEAVKRVVGVAGDLADLPDGPRRLGAGEVAVAGDRPEWSTDSRQLGALPLGAVVGVAVARYYPPERAAGRDALAAGAAREIPFPGLVAMPLLVLTLRHEAMTGRR